eukprot:TRINITY_DN5043_c0_g1_i2.p1 TRINITY_DN5043_c0_g1~~TRINITY_DN5043_c0_g1_i2.p1  ORF type:complete len:128 (-),score=21.23 TRINITY_DN5043_c0_g1_i2:237-620(-)
MADQVRTGLAQICSLSGSEKEGKRWLHGHIIDLFTKKCIGLMGTELIDYIDTTIHQCCIGDEPPIYYNITLIDYESQEELTEVATRTNGDYFKLSSPHFRFVTEILKADHQAESHIQKFFPLASLSG